MLVAQWAGARAWELYGGDPFDWTPWYEIVCSAVEAATAELNTPPEEPQQHAQHEREL